MALMKLEMHAAVPLVPEHSLFEVEITIKKLKGM
jgi:hypothetical protein